MSQNDFNIANQGFPATRADINSALQALASTSAGATAPSTTYAYQMWYDETADLLKMRNSDNDAWITLAAFDQTADEWELRSAVIQAVDSAGVVIKTDDGITRVTVADNGNVTLANDLVVTGTVQASNISATGSMASRNKIINGAMTIDQRNAGAAVTADNTFLVDRFGQRQVGGGVLSYQQSATAPAGFVNSLSVTVATADASIAAGDNYHLFHRIEGANTADFDFGSASAKSVTLSFWVRSSLTGTFGGCLQNSGANRSYVFQYAISASDTWEYKTITIEGDTSGTWLTTTGQGVSVIYDMGCGTNFEGTANAWNAANNRRASGNVQLVGTSGATFYLTGVQLEAGDTATPFEHRSYGQELALCQRYFQKYTNPPLRGISSTSSTAARNAMVLPTTMRATPTASLSGTLSIFDGGADTTTVISVSYAKADKVEFDFVTTGLLTAGRPACFFETSPGGSISLSAEL